MTMHIIIFLLRIQRAAEINYWIGWPREIVGKKGLLISRAHRALLYSLWRPSIVVDTGRLGQPIRHFIWVIMVIEAIHQRPVHELSFLVQFWPFTWIFNLHWSSYLRIDLGNELLWLQVVRCIVIEWLEKLGDYRRLTVPVGNCQFYNGGSLQQRRLNPADRAREWSDVTVV
jgi:hypothetical protein